MSHLDESNCKVCDGRSITATCHRQNVQYLDNIHLYRKCFSAISLSAHEKATCTLTFVSLIFPLSLLFRDKLLTTDTGCTSSSSHQSELNMQPIWMDGPWTCWKQSSSSSTTTSSLSLLFPSVSSTQASTQTPGQLFLSAGAEKEALPLFLAVIQLCYRVIGKDVLCMLSLPSDNLKNTSPLSNPAAVTCGLLVFVLSLLFSHPNLCALL